MADPEILADAVGRALDAYGDLVGLGESIDDEWSYVSDLEASWRSALEAVAAARGDETLAEGRSRAVDRAIDEIGRITDPHRAIDWMSTFPQVVLAAIGAAG